MIAVHLCFAFKLEQWKVRPAKGKCRINSNKTIYDLPWMTLCVIRCIRIFSRRRNELTTETIMDIISQLYNLCEIYHLSGLNIIRRGEERGLSNDCL